MAAQQLIRLLFKPGTSPTDIAAAIQSVRKKHGKK